MGVKKGNSRPYGFEGVDVTLPILVNRLGCWVIDDIGQLPWRYFIFNIVWQSFHP